MSERDPGNTGHQVVIDAEYSFDGLGSTQSFGCDVEVFDAEEAFGRHQSRLDRKSWIPGTPAIRSASTRSTVSMAWARRSPLDATWRFSTLRKHLAAIRADSRMNGSGVRSSSLTRRYSRPARRIQWSDPSMLPACRAARAACRKAIAAR